MKLYKSTAAALVADPVWAGVVGLDFEVKMEKPVRDGERRACFEEVISLGQILYHDFAELREAREDIDGIVVEFTREATEEHFEAPLPYRNTCGVPFTRRFGFLVQHFFNHQTHHRGQVTTLLTQLGLDPGDTDLVVLVPEFEEE